MHKIYKGKKGYITNNVGKLQGNTLDEQTKVGYKKKKKHLYFQKYFAGSDGPSPRKKMKRRSKY